MSKTIITPLYSDVKLEDPSQEEPDKPAPECPVKSTLESPPVAAKRTSIISQSDNRNSLIISQPEKRASLISKSGNCNNSNSVSRGSSFQGGSLLLENPRLVSPSGCGMLEVCHLLRKKKYNYIYIINLP